MFYLDLVSGHDFVARIFCLNEENGSPVRFLTDCGSVPGGSVSKPVPCRFNSLRFLNSGSGRFVGLLTLHVMPIYIFVYMFMIHMICICKTMKQII